MSEIQLATKKIERCRDEHKHEADPKPYYCGASVVIVGLIIFTALLGFLCFQIGGLNLVALQLFVTGFLSFLTLIVIAVQADIYQRQAKLMRETLEEITDQKILMDDQAGIMRGQLTQMISQGETMQGQLKKMEKQISLTRDQFNRTIIAERAYFTVSTIEFLYTDVLCVIFGYFINGGKTPAWDFRTGGTIVFDREKAKHYDWSKRISTDNPSLVPPSITPKVMQLVNFPCDLKAQRELREFGGQEWFIDGECRYRDFDGKLHAVRFGFTVTHFGPISKPKSRERYQEHYEPTDDKTTN